MRGRVLGVSLLAAAAGLLRLAAARGDLWLDEIWSLTLAAKAHSARDVFTALHLDNNHYLVTLWMFLLGVDRAGFWYRVPSLVAGIASVGLAAAAAGRFGRMPGLFAAVLTAFSLPLVVYSSEARGYSLAVCFALAAFLLLDRLLEKGRLADALLFGSVAVLGLLSHLTFVHVLVAGLVWTAIRLATRPAAPSRMAVLAAAWAPPILALAALWAVDLSKLAIGGGERASFVDIVKRTGSLLLGGPDSAAASVLLPVAGVGVAAGLYRLRRTAGDAWVFPAVALASSILALALPQVAVRHPRYLLVSVPFAFLALAVLLGGFWNRGAAGKACAAACLAGILGGDALRLAVFLRDGRGHYADAVRFMASGAEGTPVTAGSDHDFRNGLVVEYFARHLALPRPLIYMRGQGHWPAGPPDWFLVHSRLPSPVHPETLTDWYGNRYVFQRDFPYASLSGFSWSLFRNASSTPQ